MNVPGRILIGTFLDPTLVRNYWGIVKVNTVLLNPDRPYFSDTRISVKDVIFGNFSLWVWDLISVSNIKEVRKEGSVSKGTFQVVPWPRIFWNFQDPQVTSISLIDRVVEKLSSVIKREVVSRTVQKGEVILN